MIFIYIYILKYPNAYTPNIQKADTKLLFGDTEHTDVGYTRNIFGM